MIFYQYVTKVASCCVDCDNLIWGKFFHFHVKKLFQNYLLFLLIFQNACILIGNMLTSKENIFLISHVKIGNNNNNEWIQNMIMYRIEAF